MPSRANTAVFRLSHPSRCTNRSLRGLIAAAAAVAGLCATFIAAGNAYAATSNPSGCSMVASPSGSNTGTGTAASPFRTAQELVNALAPGEVGCLEAGTYAGGLTFRRGGTAAAPIVLRSAPGAQAEVTGRVYTAEGANYVTVADLSLDGNYQSTGEPLPSPTINANDDTFEYDDITNEHTAICFLIGGAEWGVAHSTVIANDEIHDCGVLPATNYNHGIYVEDAVDTQIVNNVIDHNADRGIQLYPYATGTVITGNVISENGEGIDISGAYGYASSDSTIEHNLIVHSLIRHDVESWYPAGNPVGTENIVRDNCVSSAGIEGASVGFTAVDNVVAAADELVPDGSAYSAKAGSACAAVVPDLTSAPATTEPSETGSKTSETGSSQPETGPSQPEPTLPETGSSGTGSSPGSPSGTESSPGSPSGTESSPESPVQETPHHDRKQHKAHGKGARKRLDHARSDGIRSGLHSKRTKSTARLSSKSKAAHLDAKVAHASVVRHSKRKR